MAARWGHKLRWIFLLAVLAAVGTVAFRNRGQLLQAVSIIRRASLPLLLGTITAIGGVYFSRGSAYRIALRVMGHTLDRLFLARTALVATSIHQLIPTAGASGYAYLTYAFHQRGIAAGQASIVALLDTLSYAAALGSLVIFAVGHLAISGSMSGPRLGLGVLPGVALLALAGAVYYLQRDRDRLLRFARRSKNCIARLAGRHWSDEPLQGFVDEYYEGKHLILGRRRAFAFMIGCQYAAIAFDWLALYTVFVALGMLPNPWTVFVGFVVAMAGVSVVGVPAGGGSFEVIMSSFFATHGIAAANGIAAALLYRVAAFWLPVLGSIVVLFRLRRGRRAARRIEEDG